MNRTEVQQLRKEGKTFQEIGDKFGVSRQRVDQVLNRDRYLARVRHYEHSFTASPNKGRRPCSYCGDIV